MSRKDPPVDPFDSSDHGVPMQETEFCSANILKVSVGTTCPRGGDAGHGGRTVIEFRDESSTAMSAWVDNEQPSTYAERIVLVFGGDSEYGTLINALRWAADTLEAQWKTNRFYRQNQP